MFLSTEQKASSIVIEADNNVEGVEKERAFLDETYGAYKLISQRKAPKIPGKDDDNEYDVLTIGLENGEKKEVIFDITSFFGKF